MDEVRPTEGVVPVLISYVGNITNFNDIQGMEVVQSQHQIKPSVVQQKAVSTSKDTSLMSVAEKGQISQISGLPGMGVANAIGVQSFGLNSPAVNTVTGSQKVLSPVPSTVCQTSLSNVVVQSITNPQRLSNAAGLKNQGVQAIQRSNKTNPSSQPSKSWVIPVHPKQQVTNPNTKFPLGVQDYRWQSGMIKAMFQLWQQQMFCDIELISKEKKTMKAHRVVLSCSSTKFFQMIHQISGCNVSRRPSETIQSLSLPEINYSTLELVIKFIYLGEVVVPNKSKYDVLKAAEYVGLDTLKDMLKPYCLVPQKERNIPNLSKDNRVQKMQQFCKQRLPTNEEPLKTPKSTPKEKEKITILQIGQSYSRVEEKETEKIKKNPENLLRRAQVIKKAQPKRKRYSDPKISDIMKKKLREYGEFSNKKSEGSKSPTVGITPARTVTAAEISASDQESDDDYVKSEESFDDEDSVDSFGNISDIMKQKLKEYESISIMKSEEEKELATNVPAPAMPKTTVTIAADIPVSDQESDDKSVKFGDSFDDYGKMEPIKNDMQDGADSKCAEHTICCQDLKEEMTANELEYDERGTCKEQQVSQEEIPYGETFSSLEAPTSYPVEFYESLFRPSTKRKKTCMDVGPKKEKLVVSREPRSDSSRTLRATRTVAKYSDMVEYSESEEESESDFENAPKKSKPTIKASEDDEDYTMSENEEEQSEESDDDSDSFDEEDFEEDSGKRKMSVQKVSLPDVEEKDISFCVSCGKQYDRDPSIKGHGCGQKPSMVGDQIKCPLCELTFVDRGACRHHLMLAHFDIPLYTCLLCGWNTKIRRSMKDHVRHICKKRDTTTRKKLLCTACGKSFPHPKALNAHEDLCFQGIKPKCEICNKAFNTAGSLRSHNWRVHKKKEDFKHKCTECGKMFTNNTNLEIHMRIHTGEKPFRCEMCDKSFRVKCSLQGHQKSVHGIMFTPTTKRHDKYIRSRNST